MKTVASCIAKKVLSLQLSRLTALACLFIPSMAEAQATITVDTATRYQTISGWEAVNYAAQEHPAFANFKDELFDRVINEAGINRIRLEVRSGAENSIDYYSQTQGGEIDPTLWRANRYATVNDNADPNVINPDGFHFTELDHVIQTTVLPLRALAAANGESFYVNLNYVAFTFQITQGGSYHHADAAEYAEFILAAFLHMDAQFGFVPDAVEVLLEPDNVSEWSGTTVGNAIVAVAARLSAAGYSPEIIAPSCARMNKAVTYFDELSNVSGALSILDEISYHRYSGVSSANLQALAARAQQHGKRTSMLEWWTAGNSIDVLFEDLTVGMNSAWQQGTLGEPSSGADDRTNLYWVDVSNPLVPVVQPNTKTRLLRQVYRFVRRGAVRIGAASSSESLRPVAFVNPTGVGERHVIVVRATAQGSFTVHGLPAGTYGINYSTGAEFNVNRANQTIASGAPIVTSIPEAGALTIYRLFPMIVAISSNEGTVDFEIHSLKPGFTGVMERKADLMTGVWQQAGFPGPGQFIQSWSAPVDSANAFFRFGLQ